MFDIILTVFQLLWKFSWINIFVPSNFWIMLGFIWNQCNMNTLFFFRIYCTIIDCSWQLRFLILIFFFSNNILILLLINYGEIVNERCFFIVYFILFWYLLFWYLVKRFFEPFSSFQPTCILVRIFMFITL